MLTNNLKGLRMDKDIAEYINELLADREKLLDEREDATEETKSELSIIYKAQKAMDYIIEEDKPETLEGEFIPTFHD